MAIDWTTAYQTHGIQPAAYQKVKYQSNPEQNRITCQDCGKQCTKARGNFVLTRSTVVCGKCYDEAKHGAYSVTTNTSPSHAPATCQHARRDTKRSTAAWNQTPDWYCLDCWTDLGKGGTR